MKNNLLALCMACALPCSAYAMNQQHEFQFTQMIYEKLMQQKKADLQRTNQIKKSGKNSPLFYTKHERRWYPTTPYNN